MPARTGIERYEDALADAGIPYRHEGSRDFYQRQEVRDLIWVLAAIDDPTDRLALVGALRSSAFAIGDEDLVRHRAEAGSLSYRAPDPRTDRRGQRGPGRAGRPAPHADPVLARRDRPARGRAHAAGGVRAHPPRRRTRRRQPAGDRRPGAPVRRRRRRRAAAVHPPPARLDRAGADRDRGDRRRGNRRRRADHDHARRQGARVPDRRARQPRRAQPQPRPARPARAGALPALPRRRQELRAPRPLQDPRLRRRLGAGEGTTSRPSACGCSTSPPPAPAST